MISVRDAHDRVLDGLPRLGAEQVPLHDRFGVGRRRRGGARRAIVARDAGLRRHDRPGRRRELIRDEQHERDAEKQRQSCHPGLESGCEGSIHPSNLIRMDETAQLREYPRCYWGVCREPMLRSARTHFGPIRSFESP